ncbi:MAG: DUF3127 domain-containing protein [Bacteroidetes bacterium]|jgi:hypothetical protein|nr:DUF3127 domain-containing protein [Bacteroidota bacterium]
MSLEVTGQVIKLLPEQSGQSQRGPWKKQDMVIETNEQYPKKIAITCWGEKVDEIQQLTPGTMVKVAINIESREYNERWYTDIKAWKIDTQVGQPTDNTNTGSFNSINEEPAGDAVFTSDETEGDLPF